MLQVGAQDFLSLPRIFLAQIYSCVFWYRPALCRQLPAAQPLPTYHSTVAPKLTSRRGGELAGRAERGDGRGRAGVAARHHSSARPPQRPEPRGAVGHPHSAPGMWHACVSRPREGPPHRTQLHTAVVGQSG